VPKIISNFFTLSECDNALAEMYQHDAQWAQCPQTGMYILGNSLLRKLSFADNAVEYGSYFNDNIYGFEAANLLREKLLTLFPKVEFTNHFSKPGFQLIKQNETPQPSVWHYDNVLMCFPFAKEFTDYDENFSEYFDEYYIFTLMLSDGKFSFDYFPETLSEFGNNFYESLENIPICKKHVNLVGDNCTNPDCQLTDYKTLYYTKGSLLVQNERTLHRVGIRDINGNVNNRTTLQSYGVVKDRTLYLFW
jgi:hypothetical protein